jgi:hypothetical protein
LTFSAPLLPINITIFRPWRAVTEHVADLPERTAHAASELQLAAEWDTRARSELREIGFDSGPQPDAIGRQVLGLAIRGKHDPGQIGRPE